MARGGSIARRRKTRNNKVRLVKNRSDESDEDYTVGENELVDTEDEYCSSLAADDETDESLGEFEEDDDEDEELEEGWVNMNVSKAVKPIGRNSYRRRRNNAVFIPRKADDDEDDEDEELEEGWVNMNINKAVKPTGCYSYRRRRNNGVVIPRKEDDAEDSEDELEEGWVNMNVNKAVKPIGRNSYRRRRNNGVVIPRKKKSAYVSDDDDDDDFSLSCKEKGDNDTSILYRQEAVNLRLEKPRKKIRVSSSEKSRKKATVSYREEKDDGESYNSDEEDSDEEFAPDEADDDDDDDDEELLVMKKNKEVCLSTHIVNGKKGKRNVKAWRDNKRKKTINGKKLEDDVRKKRKATEKGRRKKKNANSDPDFVSSDYEYTISEEEREQIREAGVFCRRSTTSIPTFDSLKTNEEEEEIVVASQRKRQERKGKEKVVDTKKIELVKQVCGICLSEEGKRSVRGILNCCNHFFCFACIMEWSKVESRCPLCKQRFVTISRTACSDGSRHVLKDDAVIPIPECDQVYQPSEEELRGYLYPYENVLCSECHHGGDDALMLLCDLCDSPAHTYCVGLGREVPEGSWYCDGCRPTALFTSPTSQSLNNNNNNNNNNNPIHPDHGASNNNGSPPFRENFDLNELYVPETPLTQVNRGQSPPSRYSSGDPIISSASTLFERRRIHRTVQQLLNNRGTRSERNVAGINLFGSRIVSQQALPAQVAGSQSIYNHNQDYRLYGWEGPRQEFNHQESTSTDYYAFGRVLHSELSGIGHQQLHPCNSRSNTGAEDTITSSTLQGHLRTPF